MFSCLFQLRSGIRRVGVAGLVVERIGKAGKIVEDKTFAERYTLFYGYPKKRVVTRARLIYIDPPLIRGKAVKAATMVLHQPVIVIVNAESRCITRDVVEKALSSIELGEQSILLLVPYTTKSLEDAYTRALDILKKFLPEASMLPPHPSYSLIIGLRKYLNVEAETLWSYEHLAVFASIISGNKRIKVGSTKCVDDVPAIFSGQALRYVRSLAKSIINLAVKKGTLSKSRAEEALKVIEEELH